MRASAAQAGDAVSPVRVVERGLILLLILVLVLVAVGVLVAIVEQPDGPQPVAAMRELS